MNDDGLVELDEVPEDPVLHNDDLDPTAADERTWSVWNLAALWVGLSVCIPTFMLSGALVDMGMNWWQATLTVFLGNMIVLVPMVMNGHAGTKYGIPFPVFTRASFGVFGAHIPNIVRGLVACGWFGIQTFVGGEAVKLMIAAVWPGFAELGGDVTFISLSIPLWVGFLIFWALNMFFVWKGTESIKWLENLAAPLLLVMGGVALWWAASKVGGFGEMLAKSSNLVGQETDVSGVQWITQIFLPGLTAVVGFWATLSLNIPDFTRYCKSQKDQMFGQAFGLPTTMVFFSFIAISLTSASLILYGEAIWDPALLVERFAHESGSATIAFATGLALVVATLSTNIAANVVAPANSFSNAFPKYISFTAGGLITGVIGIVICPWLIKDQLSGFLVSYSGVLGPVGGILIADYWLLRGTEYDLADLYRSGGRYRYDGGFNWAAITALIVGVGVVLAGKVVPGFGFLFQGAWFTGLAVSILVYWLMMRDKVEETVPDEAG